MRFVLRLLITAAAVALAAQVVDGIAFEGARSGQAELEDKWLPLLLVALISNVVTSFVKPVLTVISIPFILLTLGLFLIVLNALLLKLTAWLAGLVDVGFSVDGFWPAVGGAIIISITTWVLDAFVRPDDEREHAR